MTSALMQQALGAIDGAPAQQQQPDTRSWPEQLAEQITKDGAADYQPAWQEFQKAQADFRQRSDREMRDAGHADRGRQLVASGAAGLPAALVERAQSAVTAETAAQQALVAATQQAQAWYDRHGKASAQLGDAHTLANTAHEDAKTAATAACRTLGAAADELDKARAVLASEKRRKDANDQQWQVADDMIDADTRAARKVLASFEV